MLVLTGLRLAPYSEMFVAAANTPTVIVFR
jgi:hypothetical protein